MSGTFPDDFPGGGNGRAEGVGLQGSSAASVTVAATPSGRFGILVSDLAALTKARLNTFVLLATAAGYLLGSRHSLEVIPLLHVLLGTVLVAAGSSTINQLMEYRADLQMLRTSNRPLPSNRIQFSEALLLGLALVIGGGLYLWFTTNPITTGLALLTLLLYVAAYTPMKRVSTLNTVIGAFPGALPPLIGWAAASKLDASAGTVFAILFLWQLPHFCAIAWLYRDQYAEAGFKMWPVEDPSGRSSGWRAVLYAAAILPIVWTPTAFGLTGWLYAVGSILLSLIFLGFAILFAKKRNDHAARRLFQASLIYIALLLSLMILDKSVSLAGF